MDDVLTTFLFLLVVFLWRTITGFDCTQNCLHCLGPLTPLAQWYTLLFVGLGVLVCRTFYDIVVFEYIKYNWLTSADLLQAEGSIPDLLDSEKAELSITPWLRHLSLAAPVAGIVAAVVVAQHVYAAVWASARRKQERGEKLKWKMGYETNMALLVIAMPIVFILMAMRAEVRIWSVMTGSAWQPYRGVSPQPTTWEVVKTLELAMYTSELELAGFFQYITIWSFGVLCVHYMQGAPAEYRMALKWAGLQGVYLYVIFGSIRSLSNLGLAVLGESPKYDYFSAVLRDKVVTAVGPVFTVATMLCVYNMLVIGKMHDVQVMLGNANMKFQATRALVLIAQIQLQVLTGLIKGGPMYLAAAKLPPPYEGIVANWDMSIYRAKLLHAALLSFECLLVALCNRHFWHAGSDYAASGPAEGGKIARAREGRSSEAAARAPLEERLLVAAE